VTPEELLNKLGPVNWLTEAEEVHRYQYVLNETQKHFPGNYGLEEAYDPVSMCFKYRLKFRAEADELWFKLKYL